MANITETPEWAEAVYQIAPGDYAAGGPEGVDNVQAQALANRTAWLKEQVETLQAVEPVAFSVTKSGVDQSINTSTFTVVTWAAPDAAHDTGSGWGTNAYTVPVAGWWSIDTAISCTPGSVTGAGFSATIAVNGVAVVEVLHRFGNNTTTSAEAHYEGPLAEGDIVTVLAWQDTGSAQPVSGTARWARFCGHLVR